MRKIKSKPRGDYSVLELTINPNNGESAYTQYVKRFSRCVVTGEVTLWLSGSSEYCERYDSDENESNQETVADELIRELETAVRQLSKTEPRERELTLVSAKFVNVIDVQVQTELWNEFRLWMTLRDEKKAKRKGD